MTKEVEAEIECISKAIMSIKYITEEEYIITPDDIYNKISEKWDVDKKELLEYLGNNYSWLFKL